MDKVTFFGGPWDGRVELLKDDYEIDGVIHHREGWPLIIEGRAYVGEKPTSEVRPAGEPAPAGRLIARYRLTDRVTLDGKQVYEYIPE
jgi:hypothetical protein